MARSPGTLRSRAASHRRRESRREAERRRGAACSAAAPTSTPPRRAAAPAPPRRWPSSAAATASGLVCHLRHAPFTRGSAMCSTARASTRRIWHRRPRARRALPGSRRWTRISALSLRGHGRRVLSSVEPGPADGSSSPALTLARPSELASRATVDASTEPPRESRPAPMAGRASGVQTSPTPSVRGARRSATGDAARRRGRRFQVQRSLVGGRPCAGPPSPSRGA